MMGDRREFRPLLFLALSVLCLVLSGQSVSSQNGVVWFSDHKELKAIDPQTNAIVRVLDLADEPDVLAADPAGDAVWILKGKRLTKLSDAGVALLAIDLNELEPGFGAAKLLAVNPYRGSLWVVAEKELLQLSANGERVAQWRASKKIDALAIDTNETPWIVAQRTLIHLGADAVPLDSIDLSQNLDKAEQLVVDGLGGVVWIADKKRLLRLNLNRITDAPQVVSTPDTGEAHNTEDENDDFGKILALDIHPVLGTLWAATEKSLLAFDRNGSFLYTAALPKSLEKPNAIAFDLAAASLWVAAKDGVGRFNGSGELVAVVPAEKEAENVAVGGFTLYPTVSILEPADGTLTNNPQPGLRLALGSSCSGIPCLLPNAYTHSLDLDVTLNGEAISSQFAIDGAEALYTPLVPLPEGTNRLMARGTDLFGHASDEVTGQFVIDTIAPKFVSIAPADGSMANEAGVEISGEVDDPTANVLLADGDGQGISMAGGAVFSFAVVLKSGLNTFALTARDPAGNETTVPLRIAYNAVSVKITTPMGGTVLSSRAAIVSGDFTGAPNTGITVNGAVAEVLGNHFYANLALSSGPNTLTAVATTQSGASVADTVTVMVNAPSVEPITITVEPQSGIAPLTVRFGVTNNGGQAVTQFSVDTNNDGTSELSVNVPTDPIDYVYATPGVYQTKIVATDGGGKQSERTVAIVVNDVRELDTTLRGIYLQMLGNLRERNIEAALTAITGGMRDKYGAVFESIEPRLPNIVDQLGMLQSGSFGREMAEYVIVRTQNGDPHAFLMYFIRSEDGVWRIDGM